MNIPAYFVTFTGSPHPSSGFEPDLAPQFCSSLYHAAPTMLYVPLGQMYRHVCPQCGAQVVLRSSVAVRF